MTTRVPLENYLKLWEAAEAEEIGVLIKVEPADQQKFVIAMFDCRKTFGGYEDIILFQPQPEGTVFLARKTAELPA
jgi:hypothetical protein